MTHGKPPKPYYLYADSSSGRLESASRQRLTPYLGSEFYYALDRAGLEADYLASAKADVWPNNVQHDFDTLASNWVISGYYQTSPENESLIQQIQAHLQTEPDELFDLISEGFEALQETVSTHQLEVSPPAVQEAFDRAIERAGCPLVHHPDGNLIIEEEFSGVLRQLQSQLPTYYEERFAYLTDQLGGIKSLGQGNANKSIAAQFAAYKPAWELAELKDIIRELMPEPERASLLTYLTQVRELCP